MLTNIVVAGTAVAGSSQCKASAHPARSEQHPRKYPFSTPFRHTKGYLWVLGGGRALEGEHGQLLRVPLFAALALFNATGQSRVTLSLQKEHF